MLAVQALVAVPAYMFVETFQALLPMALGFAAGCMVWIVCAELIPDALAAAPHPQVATAATLSAAWCGQGKQWPCLVLCHTVHSCYECSSQIHPLPASCILLDT